MVYATCTLVREENEGVIDNFLQKHPEFHLEPADGIFSGPVSERITRDGFLQTSPLVGYLDAFFAARLARQTI